MPTIKDYQITEQLYESTHSLVYRARRNIDDRPVVLKVLKGEYPPPEELARFKREYEMTRSLRDVDGIIQVYAQESYKNSLAMVVEDFGADSLTNILKKRALNVTEFLRLAIRISDILSRIHQQQIMHKDINPSNIVWNPDTDELKIIDFGISTTLSREQPEIRSPDVLEGTLAYISPEQTGRMNRAMDYRTDLYSLGATLYHLLTGQVPFQTSDAMELVHCHLAKMPVPPCDIPLPGGAGVGSGVQNLDFAAESPIPPSGVSNPGLTAKSSISPIPSREGAGVGSLSASPTAKSRFCTPKILSDIILKLLAKNAEDRYQSAFGLKADLQNCLDQLIATGTIELFEIAQHDVSDRFQIPQKLYGREQEIDTLLAAFDRVSTYSPPGRGRGGYSPLEGGQGGVSLEGGQGGVIPLPGGVRGGFSHVEMILVAGYSGIGKSALVHEIHKPITAKRGYFISGKFDQFKRNEPYSALIQAFQALVRQLLTESQEQLGLWKEKLLKALGPNGQVIIEVIPEVELIIGEQPAVPELPPNQAHNRFNFVFQNFVRTFAAPEHPLVIFLDDLQ